MTDKMYEEIVNFVKNASMGFMPGNLTYILNRYATRLKKVYHIEPVDIVAAICMIDEGNYDYARILLKRAYRDLVRIGRERGLL